MTNEHTPEKMKEHLLMIIDGLKMKAENHTIDYMTIKADEKIVLVFKDNERYATGAKSKGFRYTIDVAYLDLAEVKVNE